MSNLTYRPHQARRAKKFAQHPDFQDPSGGADFNRIAQEVGISRECVRYILTGELPAPPPTFEIKGDGDGTD